MPRFARGLADGHFYHIVNRENCRHEVFLKTDDCAEFANQMKESVSRHEAVNYCAGLLADRHHMAWRAGKAGW